MSPGKAKTLLVALLAIAALATSPGAASAAAPAWSIQSMPAPTNFKPGGEGSYQVFFANSGGQVTNQSEITITDTLPAGLEVKGVALFPPRRSDIDIGDPPACEVDEDIPSEVSTVTCKVTDSLLPGKEPSKLHPDDQLLLVVEVETPPAATGTLVNQVEVKGGGAATAFGEFENEASAAPSAAGFYEFNADLGDANGEAESEAAAHPYAYTTTFAVNINTSPEGSTFPFSPAGGDLREIEVALPPGLVGNPMAVERCPIQDFNTTHGVSPEPGVNYSPNECAEDAAVGVAVLQQKEGKPGIYKAPIYNLEPPYGSPVLLGFQVAGVPIYIEARVRSESDYGFVGYLQNITEAQRVTATRVSIWGTPGDAGHDALRGECAEVGGECPAEGELGPFWRLPSSCANPLAVRMSFSTWAQPPNGASATEESGAPVGCGAPPFGPSIEARPTTNLADSPSGLHFKLSLPQNQDPDGLGEADLRDATVRLAAGLVANPAQANGRAACTPEQIGLITPLGALPPHFDEEPVGCPNASKLGNVSVKTPLLDHPLPGAVYLAAQENNPFKSLIAIYIAIDDPQSGVVAKLAGKVTPDPVTGQLTTTVTENPQVPFEEFTFDFFEGARASLRTPMSCANHTTSADLVPWSAPEGPAAARSSAFQITAGPNGPCPTGALDPKLSAGLANPTAGTYSPFSLRLSRADGTGEFAGLTTIPPLGLVAKLAGVPYCPEAAIAQALSRSAPGQGAAEANQPSCPTASQLGSTTAGAGAGPSPFYTGGRLYLAGPYKGAPLSFVAIIPATAGPFDLGVVVNRIAVQIDTESAQVRAVADPLPMILSGIPLDVRDIRVDLDRPNFALAPTSCEPKSVLATVLGTSGPATTVSDRFQVGGCKGLGFKPNISLRLKGGTRRGDHPALKAVVTYPKGAYANLARASVALPHSEFLENAHFKTICTRVQFAADACPKGSIYGKARAITPLLDAPLEGPVYLRSSKNPLPDLVMALDGQIEFDAVGRIDSVNGGIRTTFDAVPDAPLTKVVLEMPGGKKSLIVNSRNICKHANRATAKLTAHNGRTHNFRPLLRASCGKGKPAKKPRR